MIISDLLSLLDQLLTPHLFKDYAPNGLQIGSITSPVNKVAVAVSADLATINKTIENQCDTLIVHHGLFWKGSPYPITGLLHNRLKALLENNISLLAYHLPLDGHKTLGNSWKAAIDLGWDSLKEFGSYSPSIGVQGEFPPIQIDVFQQQLENYYLAPIKAIVHSSKQSITSAALMSGGAYKELYHAANTVDCFITGNFDEPAWSIAKEYDITFIALGHTATEKVGPKALANYLKNQISSSVKFIDTENPF